MTSTEKTAKEAQSPWYASYPAPKIEARGISREEVLGLLMDGEKVAGKDFVLVDLRRNDHEGGTIHGSINLPAQSLWPTIPVVYELFKAAGILQVIWYCGSSRGRGSRAAGWFADHIAAKGDEEMESLVLLEGIKGWVASGESYVHLVDEYQAEAWGKGS